MIASPSSARRGGASIGRAVLVALVACGPRSPDARYPARGPGCAVKGYPGPPASAVDDLGAVRVQCADRDPKGCERTLLDAVCSRGGDVAWGLADDPLTALTRNAHAAHTRRATEGARARGCAVRVFDPAPTVQTENIGPVTAVCAADDTKETCLRELEDQVCLLGGDVLWQVEGPAADGDRRRMRGRAAHVK